MKKLKIIIIVFIVIIAITAGFLIVLNRNGDVSPKLDNVVETQEIMTHAHEIEEEKETSDKVKDSEKFFTVSACVSQYLDLLNKNYDIYYGYDDNNQYTQIVNPYEGIWDVLSEKYIKDNNITKDNLKNHIQLLENKVVFVPLEMRVIENTNTEKYLVYGMIQNLDNQYMGDIYLFVNLCEINATFSIEPIQNKYNNIYEVDYTNEEEMIKEKDFNDYVPVKMNSESMCQQYFNLYKSIALAKPEKAYEFLGKEYREKRFGEVSSYIKYLKDNQEDLKTLQLTQYLVNGYDEYTEYVCKDKYENLYIFKETALMEFTMELDTYTIPTEQFKKTYRTANQQKKVMMNIDKWIQMLNNRDYTSAYKVLNETFRNNNFGSEEKFVAYMKEKYPLHYKIEFSSFSEEGSACVQSIKLKEIGSESAEGKDLDIIMKLKEDTDFEMSFNKE